MGHWAERSLPELKEKLGIQGDEQDAELLRYARQTQAQVEMLTGHRFEGETERLNLETNGLPFCPTLDMQSATMKSQAEVWPIVDPIHPEFANILQIARAQDLPSRAVPKTDALIAGALALSAVHRDGWLKFAPRVWFAQQSKAGPTVEFARGLMDPGRHVHVPVVMGEVEGWWVQISRRIYIVTSDTPDAPGLVEMLAPPAHGMGVVAGEPILVLARMTEHPSDWAFVARVWAEDAAVPPSRSWRSIAPAVHGHGLPIITLDELSTPEEVVAQILLTAYWHGYIDGDEANVIPAFLAAAFPRAVESVRRGTGAADSAAAAAALFRRLLRPGFDPTRGAGSIRRYIARHATTLVRERRTELASSHPWDELGIAERHYYKLMARFATKGPDGRYHVDEEARAKPAIGAYLAEGRRRQATLELLRVRGFGEAAARKWLQRHDISEVANAKPSRPAREPGASPER